MTETNRTLRERKLDALTGSVILNQLALNFNEELKYTKFYKQNLKRTLNLTIKELVKAEEKEFDLVYDAEEKQTSYISENVMHIIMEITRNGFADMVVLGNMMIAHQKDPKAIEGIVKKILTNKN